MAGIRIQTTHVGSLPGPPDFDATALHDEESLRAAVEWVVEQQRAAGIDIINEGELTKGGDWLSFADRRLGGFEDRPFPPGGSMVSRGQDRQQFADFYKYATERQTLFFTPTIASSSRGVTPSRPHRCRTSACASSRARSTCCDGSSATRIAAS